MVSRAIIENIFQTNDLDTGDDGLIVEFAENVLTERVDWDAVIDGILEEHVASGAMEDAPIDELPDGYMEEQESLDQGQFIPDEEEDELEDIGTIDEDKINRYFHVPTEVSLFDELGNQKIPGWYVADCREDDTGGFGIEYLGPYNTKEQAQDVWIALD